MSKTTLKVRKQAQPTLERLSVLVYGQPKIGKTRFASTMPQPLFLACEPGGCDFLTGVDVVDVAALGELVQAAGELARGGGQGYRTIVVDGITWLATQAAQQAARGQKDARQGYRAVTEQISEAVSGMLAAGLSVVATGHGRSWTEDTGKVVTTPDVNEALADDLAGLFSIVLYAHLGRDGQAVALTKPVDSEKRRIVAGDRSGKLPKIMALDAPAMLVTLTPAAQEAPQRSAAVDEAADAPPPPPGAAAQANGHVMAEEEVSTFWKQGG